MVVISWSRVSVHVIRYVYFLRIRLSHNMNVRDNGRNDVVGEDFPSILNELKHMGCVLLMTGDVGASVRTRQTRRLFGDPTIERERILVLTDTVRTQYIDNLPNGLSPDHPSVHLLNYREPLRAQTEAESPAPDPATPDLGDSDLETATVDDLTDLRETIMDTITVIETDSTPLAAATLRLGLTDLSVLLDLYGIDRVESFVGSVGDAVRDHRGMGFFYLAVANDDPVVQSLLPYFDIHIALRESPSAPATHRWYLPEYDLSSGWLEF
jgi:hypothetical protein